MAGDLAVAVIVIVDVRGRAVDQRRLRCRAAKVRSDEDGLRVAAFRRNGLADDVVSSSAPAKATAHQSRKQSFALSRSAAATASRSKAVAIAARASVGEAVGIVRTPRRRR
jgi:hypothetical protein